MIGSHYHPTGIKAVNDFSYQIFQFANSLSTRLKGIMFSRRFITNGINGVVVDIHHFGILNGVAALLIGPAHQFFVRHRHAINALQHFIAIF